MASKDGAPFSPKFSITWPKSFHDILIFSLSCILQFYSVFHNPEGVISSSPATSSEGSSREIEFSFPVNARPTGSNPG